MQLKSLWECKNPEEHHTSKKDLFGILLHVVVKCLNIYQVLLLIQCDKIIDAPESVSTNLSCTVSKNTENIGSRNFDDRKLRHKTYCCILHMVLLVVILLSMIAVIFYR